MARVGVFGLNLSPKSGGAFNLIKSLMENARFSEHEFIYFHGDGLTDITFPDNVRPIARSASHRLAVQGLFRLSFADRILHRKEIALGAFSFFTGIKRATFREVEVWLWPHCFSLVPNLSPIVAIFHDMIHKYYPQLFTRSVLRRRKRAELSMHRCAKIVCPSTTVKNDLLISYPELQHKATTCWEAACELVAREHCQDEMRAIRDLHGSGALFLYVAADWPHKNHRLLVQAAAQLRQKTPAPFHVIFVGSRRGNHIRHLIQEAKAGEWITDVGNVSRERLSAYYYLATALVFPSLHEGFGIPLVEAMQCGVPIIASDRASIPEISGSAAILLPPDRPDIWADRMLMLLSTESCRHKYSCLSLNRAALFTWQKCWQRMDEVLDEALLTGVD